MEKNGWHNLSDLGEGETPFPNAMLIRAMLSEAFARSSNIDLIRAGKDYGKRENRCFLLNSVMLLFLFQWWAWG